MDDTGIDDGDLRHDLLTRTELISKFGAANYVVFGVMLLISALIGLYFWWKGQKSTEEFLLGGRDVPTFPMALSLMASFVSAITLLGTPSEMYVSGTQYAMFALSFPFTMWSTANLYLPVFYELKLTTSYEYLEMRFNKPVRILAACLFVLQMILYMAIVVYAPALGLSLVTGFNIDAACAVIFIVCVFYCSAGGIKAVMWTDTFQSIVMFVAFLAIIIKGNYDSGGSYEVFDRNYRSGRVELFNFEPDMRQRHTVWAMVIGGYFLGMSIYGVNQTQVQRYLTVSRRSKAVKAIWWSGFLFVFITLTCCYAGMVVYGYYFNCDPLSSGQIFHKDQIFPLFVMQVMGDYPGVPGLFIAGVFSGALSSVSSGLNSLAAVALKGFIQSCCKVDLTPMKQNIALKLLSAAFGAIAYAFIWVIKYLPGVLEAAIGIFGIIGGPILGVFSLGMFVPFANSLGAFVGTIASLVFMLFIGFGRGKGKRSGCFEPRFEPKMPVTTDYCPPCYFDKNITCEASAGMISDMTSNLTSMIPDMTNIIPDTTSVMSNMTSVIPDMTSVMSNMTSSNLTSLELDMTSSNLTACEASGFRMLPIYQVSYYWAAAIGCMVVIVVGSLVSLVKPTDYRRLDKRLVSPGVPALFSWWPAPIRNWIIGYWDDIGSAVPAATGKGMDNLNYVNTEKRDVGSTHL